MGNPALPSAKRAAYNSYRYTNRYKAKPHSQEQGFLPFWMVGGEGLEPPTRRV